MGSSQNTNNGNAGQSEKIIENSSPKPLRYLQIFLLFVKMAVDMLSPRRSGALDFQNSMKFHASADDFKANEKLLEKRKDDEDKFYDKSASSKGSGGNPRTRFPENHFSRNVDTIDKTQLLKTARIMPKGAHLHLHFNSTLPPGFLLTIAKGMKNMYISSPTHKLRSKDDFRDCEIVFTLRPLGEVLEGLSEDPVSRGRELVEKDKRGPNIFHDDYEPRQLMRFQYFLTAWNEEQEVRQRPLSRNGEQIGSAEPTVWDMSMDCDKWLISKLIFSKEDIDLIFNPTDKASNQTQESQAAKEEQPRRPQAEEAKWPKDIETKFQQSPYKDDRKRAIRAWEKFNGRTRMMKGLFNYEKAFRAYTRKCLEEFVTENVQYAEIRPNFMKSNQVLQDDGAGSFDNFGLMEIIIDEYKTFMKDIGDMDENGNIIKSDGHIPSLGGMKVIYCTPRSFSKEMVRESLKECIKMKKQWSEYIAGFDLVGEEAYDKQYPLRYFEEEFTQFQKNCQEEGVKIPFLFHCGETPDDIEGNLECALRLGAKRIGHGYALPEKPEVMKEMKANKVCVEACPISNMILGLVERMDEHRIYELLAYGIHCSLNSDNGTLFRSTLSHDFYEVMVGNREMNLFGWRQLAKWSIDHSCLSDDERKRIIVEWERRWKHEFIPEILGKQVRPIRLDRLEKAEEIRQARERQFQSSLTTDVPI
ncbi:Metallo-dependent hydrolase [Hypoxylon trugodes]|uniref:Metallo-dependent hydrolase n=1 Tax=Hypoxylon trugodes TaxID=326681 RepID=UPI0021972E52|nr:Metallo-dependent hydrolase [Hypoxylon trugodes]KAI1387532.1 Metallo-dependent hydrolase [Hypoxylon trugodes]